MCSCAILSIWHVSISCIDEWFGDEQTEIYDSTEANEMKIGKTQNRHFFNGRLFAREFQCKQQQQKNDNNFDDYNLHNCMANDAVI